jgi:hypothetical protein
MLTAPTAQADSVVIGDVTFTIPKPVGFAPVTPKMNALYELDRRAVPRSAEWLAEYIPESEVGKALDGTVDSPILNNRRWFQIQVTRAVVNWHFSPSDFTQLKGIIKTQNAELVRRGGREAPDGIKDDMKNANEYAKTNYGMTVELLGTRILPVHEETNRSISFSLFQKGSVTDRTGSSTTYVSAGTSTALYLKGKVLLLYCYAEENGLKWSRAALKQWADTIAAANSP